MTTMKAPRPSPSDRLTVATGMVPSAEWSSRTDVPRGSRPDDQLAATAPAPTGGIPPGGVLLVSDCRPVPDAVVKPPG